MTDRPRPTVADAIRKFGPAVTRCSHRARSVLRRICDCRTAALGGHVWKCDACDHERVAYNSCRDRHCPQCQATQSREWLDRRLTEVLPVPHFHAVFTLPQELRPLALGNPKAMYTLLFDAAADTLRTIGRDPKHLGANLGFFGILHTWGQTLDYHPHVHFVIPGGGLSRDGSEWVPSRPRFLVSARVLAALFRRLFLEGLKRLREDGTIDPPPDLVNPHRWRKLLRRLRRQRWTVYLKEPFATPVRVLEYLARYTHRVAIANGRLRAIDDHGVVFGYKDYRDQTLKVLRLDGAEFVRRFALHVLPKRFVRLRYYGFLAHRDRTANLTRCRELIEAGGHAVPEGQCRERREETPRADLELTTASLLGEDPSPVRRCPHCRAAMFRVRELKPGDSYEPAAVHTQASRAPPAE